MYFPLVRAASKMVWPALASTYSPSILTEILSGMVEMILLAAWEGGQFCPGVPLRGTAFSRLWPPRKAAAAKIGRPPERLVHGGVGGHAGSLNLDQIRNAMAVLVFTDVATQAAPGFVQDWPPSGAAGAWWSWWTCRLLKPRPDPKRDGRAGFHGCRNAGSARLRPGPAAR